jgi:mannose-1-phosphate guanylyltransferase
MKALVLSAGFGTRLGELTRDAPKPMLDVNGRPLLEHICRHLGSLGFDQIAVNLHFMPEAIRAHFGTGRRCGVEITYSYEPKLLGTAGGLKNLESFFRDADAMLVHYGDVLTDQDFGEMLAFHRRKSALVTTLVHRRERSNSVVGMAADGRVTAFLERPDDAQRRTVDSPWVNSGVCICHRQVLDLIPPKQPCDLARDVLPMLVAEGRLYGYPLTGYRCAVDSPLRLQEARAAVATGRCQIQRPDLLRRNVAA